MMAAGAVWVAIVVRRHGGIGGRRQMSRARRFNPLAERKIGTMACARVLERSAWNVKPKRG